MPTHVTEAWGGIYFQTIVTLLVFALGIPSLVVQIMMPADVQRILTNKRLRSSRLLLILTLLYCGVAASFVWTYHPWQTGPGSTDDWRGGFVITGILVLTVLFWIHQFQRGSREMVVNRIRRLGLTGILRNNRLDEEIVETLAYLGENGHSGHEKEICVEALFEFGKALQSSKGYCGESLEPIVLAMETTIATDISRPRDIEAVIRRLSSFVNHIEILKRTDSADIGVIFRTITRISTRAANTMPEALGLSLIETITSFTAISDQLKAKCTFDIGREAVRINRYLLAMAALSKLESLVHRSARKHASMVCIANFVGLLTLQGLHGKSIRVNLISRLQAAIVAVGFTIDELFEKSAEYFQHGSDFSTADAILEFKDISSSLRSGSARRSPS